MGQRCFIKFVFTINKEYVRREFIRNIGIRRMNDYE